MTKIFRYAGIYVLSLAFTIFVRAIPLVAGREHGAARKAGRTRSRPREDHDYLLARWMATSHQGTFKLKRAVVDILSFNRKNDRYHYSRRG